MEDVLKIGIKGELILIKAEGRMRAGNCFSLNQFLHPYIENVKRKIKIMIDLSKCDYMDSTFIGFILSLIIKHQSHTPDSVKILNPSEKCKKLLKGLSCLKQVNVCNNTQIPNISTFKLENSVSDFNCRENIELVFEAHKRLSKINKKNRDEFKSLVNELKRVLKSRNNH